MGIFDDAVPGGNIAKPLLVALGALLVGKMMSGSGSAQPAPRAPAPTDTGFGGGLPGGLGGLLDKLTSAGHGSAVNSWLGSGANAQIPPENLGSALGQTTISELARNAGMSEQQLLSELSRVLPGVVDRLTPNGQIPDQARIRSLFSS